MQRENPLDNPLILSHVFNYLPLDERKSFRLVSGLWRDVTSDKWRNTAVVLIQNNDHYVNFGSSRSTRKHGGIKEFLKLHKNNEKLQPSDGSSERISQGKPFRRFHIKDYVTLPPYPSKTSSQDTADPYKVFFESFGQSIQYLNIAWRPIIRQGRFVDGLKWLFKSCPDLRELSIFSFVNDVDKLPEQVIFEERKTADNLTSLRISSEGTFSGETEAEWGTEVEVAKEVLKLVPNLLHLELGGNSIFTVGALNNSILGENKKFIKLESLDLSFGNGLRRFYNEVECFTSLKEYVEEVNPPLKRVKLGVYMSEIRQPQCPFQGFLGSLKESLTKLNITVHSIQHQKDNSRWITDLNGLFLPNLTELKIKSDEEWYYADPVRFDFKALKGFPKLRRFHYSYYCYEGEGKAKEDRWLREGHLQEGELEDFELGELEEFKFLFYERLDATSLRKLKKWMPEVKKLSLNVDSEVFGEVFQLWPDIEKVTLFYRSTVDNQMVENERGKRKGEIEGVLSKEESYARFN